MIRRVEHADKLWISWGISPSVSTPPMKKEMATDSY
jgi:hypothetical protein